MNKEELFHRIESLKEEDMVFTLGGAKVANRFDKEENPLEEGDTSTDLAIALYGFVANAIFLKASTHDFSLNGFSDFASYLNQIVSKNPEKERDKENCLNTIHRFLFEKDKLTMENLFEASYPLAVQDEINRHPEKEKEITKVAEKKKEVIFNEATLFIRSLYHSVLTYADNSISEKIQFDKDNYANGILLYDRKVLFLPVWEDAFTLKKYKEVALRDLKTLSPTFPIGEAESISLLFFGKDMVVSAKLI